MWSADTLITCLKRDFSEKYQEFFLIYIFNAFITRYNTYMPTPMPAMYKSKRIKFTALKIATFHRPPY